MRTSFCLITIFSTLFISSCANKPDLYKPQRVASSEMGVVFIDVNQATTKNKSRSLNFKIRNYEQPNSETYTIDNSNVILGVLEREYNYSDNPIMLEPGKYYIDEIELLPDSEYKYFWPAPGIENGLIRYGMFEVKAGEVLSLGEYHIASSRAFNQIKFTDNHNIVKQQLESIILKDEKYQLLSQKLKAGKFYMPGSIVDGSRIIDASRVKQIRKELIDYVLQEDKTSLLKVEKNKQ